MALPQHPPPDDESLPPSPGNERPAVRRSASAPLPRAVQLGTTRVPPLGQRPRRRRRRRPGNGRHPASRGLRLEAVSDLCSLGQGSSDRSCPSSGRLGDPRDTDGYRPLALRSHFLLESPDERGTGVRISVQLGRRAGASLRLVRGLGSVDDPSWSDAHLVERPPPDGGFSGTHSVGTYRDPEHPLARSCLAPRSRGSVCQQESSRAPPRTRPTCTPSWSGPP